MRANQLLPLGVAILLAGGAAQAADPESCQTVRFSDVGWTDITSTTAATSVVLRGLGYQPEVEILSVPVTYASLKNQDIDVFLGNWMPTMEADVRPYLEDGSVESIGVNLEGAKYTLAVPTYRSEQGMLAQVARATRGEDPIVFLGWEPHPMNANFELTYLSGGDDWFGPNYGGATVYTNVRAGYLEECPNVGQLLNNLKFTLEMENQIMGAILDEGEDPEAAASSWLEEHPEVLDSWLDGVTTFEGEPGLPAVKEHLGVS